MIDCFGCDIAYDKAERNHRFLEEALELVQSLGCTVEEVQKATDYVFSRPVGEPRQEVGGVVVTLSNLAAVAGIDWERAAEEEYDRILTKVVAIRNKQKLKPKFS